MRVSKINLVLSLLLVTLSLGFSISICNVQLNSPWFKVNDSGMNTVLLADDTGNVFLQGKSHTGVISSNSFILATDFFFNKDISKFTSTFSQQPTVDTQSALIIKNNQNISVASFSAGVIKAKGFIVAQGEHANCDKNGLYCSITQPTVVETRNYYCDILGNEQGACKYTATPVEDCALKASTDSDGGKMYHVFGTVTDYNSCYNGGCVGTNYDDVCTTTTQLKEYSVAGSAIQSDLYNCNVEDYSYCSGPVGLDVRTVKHSCSSGACDSGVDKLSMTCLALPSSYSSWTCGPTSTTRTRTVTTFTPTCSLGVCGSTSSQTPETQACPANQYCIMQNGQGNCVSYTYTWQVTGTGACSATCGAGTMSQSYICKRNDGVTVTNGYCPVASKPADTVTCNNGPCCTSVCTSGAKQCSGTTGYQTCGDYNGDSCTEWSSVISCSTGNTCSGAGTCVNPNACTTLGAHRCAVDPGFTSCNGMELQGKPVSQVCKNYVWTTETQCGCAGCNSGTGMCKTACTPTLTPAASTVCSGTSFYQTNSCTGASQLAYGTKSCTATCTAGYYSAGGGPFYSDPCPAACSSRSMTASSTYGYGNGCQGYNGGTFNGNTCYTTNNAWVCTNSGVCGPSTGGSQGSISSCYCTCTGGGGTGGGTTNGCSKCTGMVSGGSVYYCASSGTCAYASSGSSVSGCTLCSGGSSGGTGCTYGYCSDGKTCARYSGQYC